MKSAKARAALEMLGQDLRQARLRRVLAIGDLAKQVGTSTTTIVRLEKGEPGVAIGTLADVLAVLGLVERLANMIDVLRDKRNNSESSDFE